MVELGFEGGIGFGGCYMAFVEGFCVTCTHR